MYRLIISWSSVDINLSIGVQNYDTTLYVDWGRRIWLSLNILLSLKYLAAAWYFASGYIAATVAAVRENVSAVAVHSIWYDAWVVDSF